MSIIGRVYPATIASFATSVSVDLGKPYAMVSVEIPTMTSNTTWTLQASTDGSTYRTVKKCVNSATLQFANVEIPSANTSVFVDVPGGYQYYKINLVNVISFTAGFKFVCYDT